MAMLPLDPIFARLLIMSKEYHCTSEVGARGGSEEQILDIVSILSVENVFYFPRDEKEKATVLHKRFASVYGDHLTYLNVFHAYREARGSSEWCGDNFINSRSMRMATEIRKQLVDYCKKLDMEEVVGLRRGCERRAARASWTRCASA